MSSHPVERHPCHDELLRKAAEALALSPVASIWDDLVCHVGRTLKLDWVFVAKLISSNNAELRTLAAWHRGHPVENFDYHLPVPLDDPSTPDVFVQVSDVRKNVQNTWLKRVKPESFGQVKLVGSLGQARGVLAVAHGKALDPRNELESMLRIYGFKATVELERELTDERFYSKLLAELRAQSVQQH